MTETPITHATRCQIEDFLCAYAHCIDDDELERWPSFFAASAVYQIISREGYEAGHPLGVMLCRGQGMMMDRIRAMRQANIYEPQRYTHMLSRAQLTRHETEGVYSSRLNFHVVRTMEDGTSGTFVTGKYIDQLQVAQHQVQLLDRRVVLDSRRVDTLLVVPL